MALGESERALAIEAALLTVPTALSLRTLGTARTCAWLAYWSRLPAADRALPPVADVEDLVRRVSRVFPWSLQCLQTAVVQVAIERRHGSATELRIGVRRDGGAVLAHAWAERDDEARASEFAPLAKTIETRVTCNEGWRLEENPEWSVLS